MVLPPLIFTPPWIFTVSEPPAATVVKDLVDDVV